MTVRTIKVEGNQTQWDIAIQEYGSIEGVFLLRADNPGVIKDINTGLLPGQLLQIKSDPLNKEVVDFYKTENKHPVSKVTGEPIPGGDFNNDFNNDFN